MRSKRRQGLEQANHQFYECLLRRSPLTYSVLLTNSLHLSQTLVGWSIETWQLPTIPSFSTIHPLLKTEDLHKVLNHVKARNNSFKETLIAKFSFDFASRWCASVCGMLSNDNEASIHVELIRRLVSKKQGQNEDNGQPACGFGLRTGQ